MSRMSNCLIFATALAAAALWTAPSLGEITLTAPQVQVSEGDRTVTLIWNDPIPENLVSIAEPTLGSVQFPWDGHAGIEAGGFYTGACDWTYNIVISLFTGADTVMELNWQEVTDWMTQRIVARRIQVTELDQVLDLSDGIEITIGSEGLFDLDMTSWTGPVPDMSGLLIDAYAGLDTADYAKPIDFTFTCTSGGELTGTSGDIGLAWEARIAWPDPALAPDSTLLGSGSVVIETAGAPNEFYGGLRLAFPAGIFVEEETFSADALIPLVAGDRFGVNASTFEGYLILRHSVEDRPAAGSDSMGLYKVIAAISKCDSFELFVDSLTGEPDPYGVHRYVDQGIMVNQPGVDPDPDVKTVLNGFPYDYAVVTYDWSSTHQQLLSEALWGRVSPSVPPALSAANVEVIPNPYVGNAGWETGGEAKIQFVNLPRGAKIRIYDVAGGYINTVRPNTYSYDPDEPQGTADWNLKDSDGKDVVSGIYLYKIESSVGSDTGRFIIVR